METINSKKELSHTVKPKKGLKKTFRKISAIIGYTLITVGLLLLAIFYLPLAWLPDATEEVLKDTKNQINTTLDKAVQEVTIATTDSIPLTIGHVGGYNELELCDGTFTQYLSYEEAGLKPTYLAHNGCGGSILLYPELESKFTVTMPDGSTKHYKLIDSLVVPQVGSTSEMISHLKGDVYFQTCFFDGSTMRVLGMEEVKEDGSPIKKPTKAPSDSSNKPVRPIELEVPTQN